MARAKGKTQKRKKIKKRAKGFSHARRKRVKAAKETLLHAGQYAFIGRKRKKRDFKKLWITRINAAAREHDMKYSQLVAGLKEKGIELDRKMLADIAVNDPEAFAEIIKKVK